MTAVGAAAPGDPSGIVTLRRSGARPLRVRAQALTTCETRAGATRAVVTVWERVGAGLAVSAVVTSPRSAAVECAVKLDSLDDLPAAADRLHAPAPRAPRRPRTPRIDAVVTDLCDRIAHEQARRAVVAALALAIDRLG